MQTGISYLGHHNPDHMARDLDEIAALGCADVFLAAQENDFTYFPGKLEQFPRLCRERGVRPLAICWGALNYFGGGKSSQLLLEYPEGRQVAETGEVLSGGCYVNATCAGYMKQMIDSVAALGFAGYFVDEPSRTECFCPACEAVFFSRHGKALRESHAGEQQEFRRQCVARYVQEISAYIKEQYPQMETICCVMERDQDIWPLLGRIEALDNVGTDLYWVNNDRPVGEMKPLLKHLAALCRENGKQHHEWLQCWGVRRGQEQRIIAQGEVLLRAQPDAVYVWGFQGQRGTSESCADPQAAWQAACRVLRAAVTG